MKVATVRSVCECQARLEADLDESRFVLRGRATQRGKTELAPAHSMGAASEKFQIGWSCPFCIRNQLRAFDAGGLSYVERPDAPPVGEAAQAE